MSFPLERAGFPSSNISYYDYQLEIIFENHNYRSYAEAMFKVLDIVQSDPRYKDSVTISIKYNNFIIGRLITDADALKLLFESSITFDHWLRASAFQLHETDQKGRDNLSTSTNIPHYTTTLELGYDFRYQLGNYNNHLRVGLDANPVLIQQLPLGFQINAGLNIPLYNDLDKNRYLRMQQLTLTHQKVLRKGLYAGTAAGFFSRNRAGIHTKIVQYLWDEIISLSFQTGYTVFTPLTGKVDDSFAEEKPFMVYTGAAEYRWRAYDLDIRLEYGQFLYHDSGLHVDVQRRFGETVIGLFALKTRLGSNYGFHVSIPLFPSKGALVSGIRLRSASHLPVTYRYEGNDLIGRMYETGLDLQFRMKQVYPSYLMKQLETFFQ